MPRYLAIEWDDHQLRALVATTSGRSVTVEQAGAIDLPTVEGKVPPPEVIGKALSDWVREHGGSRAGTLVAVGRASIELRRFTLPPAPDDELPEMVRFQAQREFTSLSEESPLDFLPLDGNATTPRQVLAACLSPDLLAQIRSVCDAAGLRAERIVLRPCATAAVARQSTKANQAGASLIVDPLLDDVDLSVVVNQKVVFIRTVRLPHVEADEKQFRPLMGELRRTIAAFHNQFREVKIESVIVCGDPQQRAALAEAIEQEFTLPTTVIHPLEAVGTTSHLKKHMPEHPGRYAPLVGMVLDEAAGSHAIDFLNPRKKAEQKTNRRSYVLAAAAALLLLGWYGWWQYDRISEKRHAVLSLDNKIKQEKDFYKENLEPVAMRAAIFNTWLKTDIPLLDKIVDMSLVLRPLPLDSEDFPAKKDVVVTSLQVSTVADGGRATFATFATFDLAISDRDLALEIGKRISEKGHALVDAGVLVKDEKRPGYVWTIPGASVQIAGPTQ